MIAKNPYDDANEVKSPIIDWGEVGDNINGTFIGANKAETQYGPNILYEIKADGGEYHVITDKVVAKEVTEIPAGEIWAVWGRGEMFDSQMKRIKFGQKLGIKFMESRPSTKGNPAKIVKIFTTGEMDTEWLEGQEVTAEDAA